MNKTEVFMDHSEAHELFMNIQVVHEQSKFMNRVNS